MRYILLLITLLLSLPTQAQEPDTTTLSVVSWNIQMLPNFFRAFSSSLRMMQGKRVPWIVEYIIGGVGIVMLLFLAYCAIAIPYYYIKKIYRRLYYQK